MFQIVVLDAVLYALTAAAPVLAWRLAQPWDWDPLLGWSVGLTAGLFGLPLIGWCVAVAAGTHVGPGLLLGVAVAVVLAGAAIGYRTAARGQGGGGKA